MQATTRVDFYILETAESASRLLFACRLTEKAYGMSTGVYAHTETLAEARKLDDMLWTFRQGSFVPHQLLTNDTGDDSDEKLRAPVSIGSGSKNEPGGDLLINLTDNLPDFANGFRRVAEIISGSDAAQEAGRERFRQYRAMGLKPETHRIND